MKRVERVRLYPTPRQERALRFMLDVTRRLFNAALEQRREAYRRRGISVSMKMQYSELTALRQDDAQVAAHCVPLRSSRNVLALANRRPRTGPCKESPPRLARPIEGTPLCTLARLCGNRKKRFPQVRGDCYGPGSGTDAEPTKTPTGGK